MDEYTISEESYKNGYKDGYEDGKKDAVVHGKWIIPTKIGGRSYPIPHCSVCDGIPCGTDEKTKYCSHCGSLNGLVEVSNMYG